MMSRYLKALGLGLLAAFALSAIAASGASAGEPFAQLTVEGGAGNSVTITGESEGEPPVLTRGARTVTCEKETLHGTAEHGDTTIELTPEWETCSTNLGGPATVTNNGCSYVFHLFYDEVEAGHTYTATADLNCNHEGSIAIDAYTTKAAHEAGNIACQYTFSDTHEGEEVNQGLTTIDLTNKAASGETPVNWLTADVNVTGIISTRTMGGALLCGAATHTTGGLISTIKLKGDDPAEPATPRGATVSDD